MPEFMRLFAVTGVLVAVAGLPPPAFAQPATPKLTDEALVNAVVQGNRSVEALQHAVAAAEARERPAGALDDPAVAYAVAPRSLGVDGLDPGHILRVEQALPWWGKRDTRRAAAAAATDSTRASLAAVQQQAMLTARQLFADWFLVHAQLRINAQQQALLADLEDTAEGLYASGLGSQSGVLSASLRREQRLQAAIALQARQRGIAARINALRDRAASTPVAPPAPLEEVDDLPSLDRLSQAVMGANPSLRQLDADQRQAARVVSLAELAYKPDVRLSVQYLGTLPREENRAQIGVALNIPFGQGKRDAALDAARAEQARTAAQRGDRQNTLLAELHDTHARTRASQDTWTLYTRRLLPLAEQALEAALADFAAGLGTAHMVIDAEDDLLQTRLGALDARTEAYRGWAKLWWLAGPEPFDATPNFDPLERSP